MKIIKSQADVTCDSLTTIKGMLVLMQKGIMGPMNMEQLKYLGVTLEALEKLIDIHDQGLRKVRISPTHRLLNPRLNLSAVRI